MTTIFSPAPTVDFCNLNPYTPPAPVWIISKKAALLRFAAAGILTTIYQAAASTPVLGASMEIFNEVAYINLQDPLINEFLGSFVTAGALTAAQQATFLTTPCQTGEQYLGPL